MLTLGHPSNHAAASICIVFSEKTSLLSFVIYDVHTCKRKVVGEEYLVLALVLGNPDDNLDILFERLAADGILQA